MPEGTSERLLPLLAFSDRELLDAIYDNADKTGWCLSITVARALDVNPRATASRMGWLKRLGMLEAYQPKKSKPPHYRLTKYGDMLHTAALSAAQERALEALKDGQPIAALNALMVMPTNRVLAAATRREFRHLDAKRPGGPRR